MKKDQNEEITIAYRIKTLREYKNLTQEELANIAGYNDKSSISKIENSGNNISLKKVNKIAEALNVSPSELLGDDDTDFRVKVLADSAEKGRVKMSPDTKELMDKFYGLLIDFRNDLYEQRSLIEEVKQMADYETLGETLEQAAEELEEKNNILNNLFDKLAETIHYEKNKKQGSS